MTVLEDPQLQSGSAGARRPGVEERATAALLECVGRFGLSKTTLDDVAREAGCSRATLYRYFDGKAALVRRAVDVELERLTTHAVTVADAQHEVLDATVALVVTAARDLVAHRPLQFLLAHEPESILGQLAFGPGDRLLVRVGDAFAPAFDRWLDLADARRAGDWIARVLRSYVLMPEPSIDLTDVAAAREFLGELVVPALESSRRNR